MWSRKVPEIRQVESSECILACLAMIARYHGARSGLAELREQFPGFGRGGSLRDLLEIADKCHFGARALKVDLASLARLTMPCILHWNFSHFVVLERVRKDHVTIVDPASGRARMSIEVLSNHFTGVAVELHPLPRFFESGDEPEAAVSPLLRVSQFHRSILAFAALSVVTLALSVVAPLAIQIVVDHVVPNKDYDLLLMVAIIFLGINGLGVLANFAQHMFVLRAASRLRLSITHEYLSKLMGRPLSHFARRDLGVFVAQFNSLHFLVSHVVKDLGSILADIAFVLLLFALLLMMSPPLAFIIIAVSAAVVIARLALVSMTRRLQNAEIVAGAQEESLFVETLRGVYSVKANWLEWQRVNVGMDRTVAAINAGFRSGAFATRFELVVNGIKIAEAILVIYLLARQVLGGAMTIGAMYTFYSYRVLLDQRLANAVTTVGSILNLRVHQQRLVDGLTAPTPRPSVTIARFMRLRGHIELKDVTYAIDNGRMTVLDGVNLRVAPRQLVHVSGPSGVGKSTLLRILLGLTPPDSGKVYFDGLAATEHAAEMIRASVGVVLQEDTLFGGSILSNVSLFDESVDLARVEECSRLCCIHDEIVQLPLSYQSVVGDMGSRLSRGQQQRLLLARALYRDPSILVLDEATANLSAPMERQILANLKGLGKTIVFASHSAALTEYRDAECNLEAYSHGRGLRLEQEQLAMPVASQA